MRREGADEALAPSNQSRLVDITAMAPAFPSAFGSRVTSTTLAVAWVAAGRRTGYVSDGVFVENLYYAAGIALFRRAGCVLTDLAGEPLERGRGLVVAGDEESHQRLIDSIHPHLADVFAPNN